MTEHIITRYSNNQICQDYYNINEKKEGVYKLYHTNGNINIECEYKDGMNDGECKEWYENGQISSKCSYINGKIEGEYIAWYKNGNKAEASSYLNGKRQGKLECWTENKEFYGEYEYKNGVIVKINSLCDQDGRENVLPQGTEVIVWKACKSLSELICSKGKNVYVKLKVPVEAKRITAINIARIMISRIEYGIVEQIIDKDGNEYNEAKSFVYQDNILIYRKGQKVVPNGFNDNILQDYEEGIHVHRYKDQCDTWFSTK